MTTTTRITVDTLFLISPDDDDLATFATRLAIDEADIDFMASATGDMYTFTASGSGNTGHAFIGGGMVAVEWGGDPQWFRDPGTGMDQEIIEVALNGDLADV